ncbi:MAG: hypothetical protein GY898_26650 [Proteobacteria bacterium]|nr:hypothetical protein [Pseudomonadota bacterium]
MSPRERAVSHVKKLMTIGAAAGTALQLSCCFPDPMPDDDDDDSGSDDDDDSGSDDDGV